MTKRSVIFSYCTIICMVTCLCGCFDKKDPIKEMIIDDTHPLCRQQLQQLPAEKMSGASITPTTSKAVSLEDELLSAIIQGDEALVRKLITQGVNVNAYYENIEDLGDRCMTKGHAVDAAGEALFYEAERPLGTMITISPAATMEDAMAHNSPAKSILWFLIEHGASLDECENLVRNIVKSGSKAFIELLMRKGVDLKKYDGILLDAAESGNEDAFRLVLSLVPDVNYCNKEGRTALIRAVADCYDGNVPRSEAIVKLLLERGADVNHHDCFGNTALILAAHNANVAIVKLLLQYKANVLAKNDNGVNALMCAALNRDINNGGTEIVKLLLTKGLSLETADKEGKTPLHWAAGSEMRNGWRDAGSVEMVKFLLQNGAKVDALDHEGRSPLINHVLLYPREKEMITTLLKAGANPSIKDKSGKTTLDYVNDDQELVNLLKSCRQRK